MSKPTNVLETLEAVRELLSDRKRWTQGEMARNKYGHSVLPTNERAVRYCLWGAIEKIEGPHQHEAFDALSNKCEWGVVNFNDNAKHPEILEKLDETIEYVRSKNAV